MMAGLCAADKPSPLEIAMETFDCQIVDMMPTVNVTFAEQSTNMTLLLDNNANYTYAWASSCKQAKPLDKTQSCSSEPTLLTPGYNINNMDTNEGSFSNYIQGGYSMSGSIIENNLTMYNTTTTAGYKTDF